MLKLKRIRPIGKEKSNAFVTLKGGKCGGMREIMVNIYPPALPEANKFREARVKAGLSLGETALKLGIGPADVSNLERGRAVPAKGWSFLLNLF